VCPARDAPKCRYARTTSSPRAGRRIWLIPGVLAAIAGSAHATAARFGAGPTRLRRVHLSVRRFGVSGRLLGARQARLDHTLSSNRPYIKLATMADGHKKITANIPALLLARAQELTGLGITETLVAGLEELERARKRSALRGLRGKVHFQLDLEKTRR
jgi:hypothetical protein